VTDVVGVGNALLDIVVHTTQEFPAAHGFVHGTATMVDEKTSDDLYARVGAATEVSGGSAANTVVGLASFGASAGYIGRVADDQLGEVFVHDLRASGVRFDVAPADDGASSGRCIVMVTPDAQRTMCTYLGASAELAPVDIDEQMITESRILYLEGYLWDEPPAKEAMRRAISVAQDHGVRVAFTLSDPFCVERHRSEFLVLVEESVDVLFANEHEIIALYEVADFEQAVAAVRGHCDTAALTRSALGSVVLDDSEIVTVAPAHVGEVVDTTGAGDQYAAGFLYGLLRGADASECGRLGSIAAAEVITHLGARPALSLAELVRR